MRFTIDPEAITRIGLDPDLAGVEFEMVERPTTGELMHVEKASKIGYDAWSSLTHSAAIAYISIRRDPSWASFSWAMALELSPADYVEVSAPQADDAETEAPADPLGSPSSSVATEA